jgi:hypothetical protein
LIWISAIVPLNFEVMSKPWLLLIILLLISSSELFSQNFLITKPKLEFDGYKLSITYDLITKGQSDIFNIWVEIRNQKGEPIRAFSFKGDLGDSTKPGNNKKITWVPEEDAIFMDDDVSVELKGEKFERSFNKGSMILISTIVPGLGQSKIKKGEPWWLASIPAYGTLAGGLIFHKKYTDTYDAYLKATEAVERSDLYNQSQKQKNLSGALFITSTVVWVSNIIWTAAIPDKYKPLQHANVSVNSIPFNHERITLLSFKVDF